ncbi:hypothetical protein C0991_003344 [Blastosporella zonata]|nr:hypothetical protein C0991_003344 [Blastosporella zonata]
MLLGGHFIGALLGVCITKLFHLLPEERFQDLVWLAGSLSCATSIVAMQITSTTHPPAGATALLAAVNTEIRDLGWYYLPVVLLTSTLALAVALLLNNIQRRYPVFWFQPAIAIPAHVSPSLGPEIGKAPERSPQETVNFAGTSIALALPLVFLARQRKQVLRKALTESNAAPPRRSTKAVSVPRPSTFVYGGSEVKSSSSHFSTPGTSELLSAISKVDLSTGVYAGKAFAIATGIVTVGGVALTLGVKSLMGVEDTKEFAARMRTLVWRGLPGLTHQIHRPPEEDDLGVPVSRSMEPDPTWKWEEAEKRMQDAYDKGGFPAWIQTAMKEMEDELNVERARRQREDERTITRESLP